MGCWVLGMAERPSEVVLTDGEGLVGAGVGTGAPAAGMGAGAWDDEGWAGCPLPSATVHKYNIEEDKNE